MAESKDEILNEIRRTAEANGGKPLGRRRFEEETGINPYAWGRYWSRFGDAQREAGYEPNALNVAFERDAIIEKYIALIRELGTIPLARRFESSAAGTRRFRLPTRLRGLEARTNASEQF